MPRPFLEEGMFGASMMDDASVHFNREFSEAEKYQVLLFFTLYQKMGQVFECFCALAE